MEFFLKCFKFFNYLQQEERKLAKLKKALKPEEFAAATLNITNKEQRLESLQSQYKELEEHYLHVIERLSTYWKAFIPLLFNKSLDKIKREISTKIWYKVVQKLI